MSGLNLKAITQDHTDILSKVSAAILAVQRETGYGSIEITVHDGRVTQIERREKVRFENTKSRVDR